LSGGGATLALIVAMRLAARTGRRLQRTRRAALAAARVELPAAITKVVAARDADDVRSALTESWARIDAMLSSGTDEIGELASAFGAVHRQALRLAADQALLRMEVQAMFVALSRRGQSLVQRQIHLIDELGRDEIDPEVLSRLFALDHLAARMRRNEENLLVLAGGEPGRWITKPVSANDLIRAAAQEIEEYQRVEIGTTPEVAVAAHVAGDAIHLLAELIENATAFSPPDAVVSVSAAQNEGGLTITVTDEGIGIPEGRLVEANERLVRPSALTSSLVGTMGLLVVARLAERHQIKVRLVSTRARGTTATVALPRELLASPADPPMSMPRIQPPTETHRPSPARPRVPTQRTAVTAESAPPEVTDAGLPRRRDQDRLPATDQGSADATQPAPDPAAIQARLASLAGGIAASQRSESDPPIHHTED
jgi:signal transduction histidine kinase